ncbi:MAG: Na(+)-translocating NADH-quinone reductase subunit A [Bacteroidales bacterium]|nr:Na(+)-translocating NADH-quinone reductase subunit A [Bacteroidales bacterium]
MSNKIVLKKGLNIPVKGAADLIVSKTVNPGIVAVRPTDFKGLLPRLLVKEGDKVLAGSPVLADKKNADILVASPVSGEVAQIVRGEKRKLLAVLIKADEQQQYLEFPKANPADMEADAVKAAILAAGLWPWIIQRPYGIIANPLDTPRSIFISAFDTAPLAACQEFCWADQMTAIQTAILALGKLTSGSVHVSINDENSSFLKLKGVKFHTFKGKHPAGNVGVQISNIAPVRKEETVWTVSPAGLAAIGKLFAKGRYDVTRKVAVAGPMAIEPSYIQTVPGMPMKELIPFYGTNADIVRIVSGNILSGSNEGTDGYLGYYDSTVSILKEGTEQELFGWIRPIRYKQFSTDHCYFSWLTPWRKYDMDTNIHGGARAFLMNDGYYAKVLPMDIYPLYLTKACLAGDIDKMEKFGIYEVIPEDLATCEFVDPSKNNIQDTIAKGIDLMLKEMA